MSRKRARVRYVTLLGSKYPTTDPLIVMLRSYINNRKEEYVMADVILQPPTLDSPPAQVISKEMSLALYPDWDATSSRIIRRPRSAFSDNARRADTWAKKQFKVFQTLHTANLFAWRVQK